MKSQIKKKILEFPLLDTNILSRTYATFQISKTNPFTHMKDEKYILPSESTKTDAEKIEKN